MITFMILFVLLFVLSCTTSITAMLIAIEDDNESATIGWLSNTFLIIVLFLIVITG